MRYKNSDTSSRKLKSDEEALWQRVKRTVEPMRGRNESFEELLREEIKPHSLRPLSHPAQARIIPTPSYSPTIVKEQTNLNAQHEIDNSTARKLIKGRLSFDGRIDLHGMTQMRAHSALLKFVQSAYEERKRIVLVITGKGRMSEGVLRIQVPHWLREPLFSNYVSGFRQSHDTHGGAGALYVRIRKPKR